MGKAIETYLQDHHAGSVAGVDAFRRVAEHHGDAEVREALTRLADEIEADQNALLEVMESLDTQPAALKDLPAKIGEKFARLKLVNRFSERSPLNDVEDLELLVMAVHGKALGWSLLLGVEDERLDRERITELLKRARAQEEELDGLRHG
ncbi:MAG TPA: hypothetical protein GX743_03565, partial [Actinomycetales bacterium]|nr:hypothetical protein [Actinomycetales bacterium]